MKTPHTIKLHFSKGEKKYDPITDSYIEAENEVKAVPCLANYVTQAKSFELYGDRTNRILVARFSQEQPPFTKAEYNGRLFTPIEQIDAPIKGAIRLKEVAHGTI